MKGGTYLVGVYFAHAYMRTHLTCIKNPINAETRKFLKELVLDNGLNVYQLETAVGAAMKCFEKAVGINVPRSRYQSVNFSSTYMHVLSCYVMLLFRKIKI